MNCLRCENHLWIEETVIDLAAMPSNNPQMKSTARQTFYQLRCANCKTIYGWKEPKDEIKSNVNDNNEIKRPNEQTKHRHTKRCETGCGLGGKRS
ncbi:MAG: hypothetical protein ACR2MD_01005 [Aridibacter sp.]